MESYNCLRPEGTFQKEEESSRYLKFFLLFAFKCQCKPNVRQSNLVTDFITFMKYLILKCFFFACHFQDSYVTSSHLMQCNWIAGILVLLKGFLDVNVSFNTIYEYKMLVLKHIFPCLVRRSLEQKFKFQQLNLIKCYLHCVRTLGNTTVWADVQVFSNIAQ